MDRTAAGCAVSGFDGLERWTCISGESSNQKGLSGPCQGRGPYETRYHSVERSNNSSKSRGVVEIGHQTPYIGSVGECVIRASTGEMRSNVSNHVMGAFLETEGVNLGAASFQLP